MRNPYFTHQRPTAAIRGEREAQISLYPTSRRDVHATPRSAPTPVCHPCGERSAPTETPSKAA